MQQKYIATLCFGQKFEGTINELVESECRNAVGYHSGQIESIQYKYDKLIEITGNLIEKLVDKKLLTPLEAASCVVYRVDSIKPVN